MAEKHYAVQPLHCLEETVTSTVITPTPEDEGSLKYLMESDPRDVGCYEDLNEEQKVAFLTYEVAVGGYLNCAVGLIGLVGNSLSMLVLSRPEMQKNNCFNKLLLGKHSCSGLVLPRHFPTRVRAQLR